MDRNELYYALKHSKVLKERKIRIEVGPVINRSELKMRIHISRPELVEPINAAIAKLRQNKTIKNIVDSYIK